MNDKVLQTEVIFNFLNTLFGKAIFLKDIKTVNELSLLRHDLYYGDDFDYEIILKKIKIIELNLNHI